MLKLACLALLLFSKCSVSSTALSVMGGSSSSRLFSTLAQSLPQPEPYSEENPDLDLDPDQLRKECEEILQHRPARPHRDLVRSTCMAPCSHKYNPPIRIMQWNILAQGKCLHFFLLVLSSGLVWVRAERVGSISVSLLFPVTCFMHHLILSCSGPSSGAVLL